jgi:lipoate---protein ligase
MTIFWRYIPPLETSGVVQMAIDSWLFNEHKLGRQPPILRFYTWSPAAISLGYHQFDYPSHWYDLCWQGQPLDLVRRVTGGRAVLHQGDLTYMIITSIKAGKRWQVYQFLCEFLIQGWRSLGVDLKYGNEERNYINSANCFNTATGADLITTAGDKLIGSAQKRQGKVLLQHGSMMIQTDPTLYSKVFGDRQSKTVKIPYIQVIEALKEAASACFEIELVTEPLSSLEWEKILSQVKRCD